MPSSNFSSEKLSGIIITQTMFSFFSPNQRIYCKNESFLFLQNSPHFKFDTTESFFNVTNSVDLYFNFSLKFDTLKVSCLEIWLQLPKNSNSNPFLEFFKNATNSESHWRKSEKMEEILITTTFQSDYKRKTPRKKQKISKQSKTIILYS